MVWHVSKESAWHALVNILVLLAQVWGRRSDCCVTENPASNAGDKSGLDPIPASPAGGTTPRHRNVTGFSSTSLLSNLQYFTQSGAYL